MSPRLSRLLLSYLWLDRWGKTPADLGLAWDQVDPAWEQAMLRISAAVQEEQRVADSG